MNIHISISFRSTATVLEEGMEHIRQAAKNSPQWKKHENHNYYEIECDIPEDDRSAQWWSTTDIKTEHHPDGTTTLSTDSRINWF